MNAGSDQALWQIRAALVALRRAHHLLTSCGMAETANALLGPLGVLDDTVGRMTDGTASKG